METNASFSGWSRPPLGWLARYARWLHTGWPAGTVEPLPEAAPDGTTAVPGLRIVGDLTGIPLLKLAADSGARAVRAIAAEPDFAVRRDGGDGHGGAAATDVLDLAIVGAGVAGISAALEAKKAGLRFEVLEAARPFQTLHDFPKAKPIFTYPSELVPAGSLELGADVKERLLEELEEQRRAAGIEPRTIRIERVERRDELLVLHPSGDGETDALRARRVIVAIGKSGDHRRLGVPGEERPKVFHRLHDPADHAGKDVLVVGGGDSALETAVALADAGARVTLSYRGADLARPKPENVARLRAASGVDVRLGTVVREVGEREVVLAAAGRPGEQRLANDVVFAMIGREAPLAFFRRSGVPIRGEWTRRSIASFGAFLLLCAFVYNWKAGGALNQLFQRHGWFPYGLVAPEPGRSSALATALGHTLREPGFYYSLAYTAAIVAFGAARIRRRRTPYVARQTLALMAFQVLPLFLLPYLLLPWAGHAGWFDGGLGKSVADAFFPVAGYGQGREYWRAFGFVLAWPLFLWNVFTAKPLTAWLVVSALQTFVLIPWLVRRWGKGAYCGWICSCGALAETVGDTQRSKMPHGPRWNRLDLVGQVVLAAALALFAARALSWLAPETSLGRFTQSFYDRWLSSATLASSGVLSYVHLDYYHLVDIGLAGIVGVGCYFWLSGRVWCRFACPLAALMHVYARFSRFRIFADKKKCISCNVCTSVCHQGIDVMAFANKGKPMEDPECVRCSACVQSCPTGVLSFGRLGADGAPILDRLAASPVQQAEGARAAH
ncbi:MAG: NAD(P)-binding domain-containing protein [Deltaproteobacteria bacterium]|nr:NAD(P)-binding domain-containing protein [Deltaproteobacteria bacterium]